LSRTLDGLTKNDWIEQKTRIHKMAENLRERKFITTGYDFPDPDPDSKLLAIAEGRRLPACVMFLDICGFSKRPMESAAEQDMTLRIMALFFSEMIRIAEAYDGQIEKNTGDGLMVYFSDIDNPATKKAVACALTMKAATSYLINPIISSTHEQTIQFRISMDYGYITIARIGAKQRFSSYVAIGTTANIASKMLRYAKEDQIILGDFARQQLPIDWQYKYTEILPFPTGWENKTTMSPYSFFLYTGRWATLV
jgi:adenylate cyclase